jgi:hypothetical protein
VSQNFRSEQEAAKAMLIEVGSLLNRHTIDYAVIGGWIPYLFNSQPIPHPGTFDVDIVLNTALSQEQVVTALDKMVNESGYRRAPKNAFQIYRELVVNNEPMMFHVDFLHRKYADDTDDLTRSWGRYQSISTVGTDIIFTEKEARSELVSRTDSSGTTASANITFASEAGFLCSKGRSVGLGKRERDGFDIYLVISQSADIKRLKKRCENLMSDGVFTASMIRLYEQFQPGQGAVEKAAKYLSAASSDFSDKELAQKEISEKVISFLNDIGVEHEL